MDPNEHRSVREWLEHIQAQGPSDATPSGKGADGDDCNFFFPTDSPFARMESVGEQQSFRKRQHPPDSSHPKQTHTNEPGIDSKRQKPAFERRPRHKTKTDRYEYKAPGHRIKRERQSEKGNRASKKNRKHTINENFHATNVPRNRLTLNSPMNLGIFRNGRSSSPVKSREQPDLAFSETHFLSKGSRQNHEELPEDPYDKRKSVSLDDKRIRQFYSNNYFKQPLDTEDPSLPILSKDNACAVVTYDNMSPAGAEDNPKGAENRPSSSATPYTWPESKHEDQNPISSEDCTKGILCADLSHRHLSDEEREPKRYWELDELKLILSIRREQRKGFEQPKASFTPLKRKHLPYEAKEVRIRHSKRPTSESIPSSGSSRTELCLGLNGPSQAIPREWIETDPETLGLDASPRTMGDSDSSEEGQGCNPSSGYITDALPIHELNLETEWADILVRTCSGETAYDEDNDVVMRNFDAAYDAIVHSDEVPAYEFLHQIPSSQGEVLTKDPSNHLSPYMASEAQNPLLSFGQNLGRNSFASAYHQWSTGLFQGGGEATNQRAFGTALSGNSIGFSWRQNKLY